VEYWRNIFCVWLVVFTLSACSDSDQADSSQKYYFLESLAVIESAGRKLQNQSITKDQLEEVLNSMDQGLKLAFQVEADFLVSLDPRLAKNYQRYFVKGVETYRLGIEAGDSAEQKQGLALLSQWSSFWAEAGGQITANIQLK